MTRNILLATALCAATAFATMAQAQSGYTTTRLDVAHRDRAVEVHIWYPTDATDAPAPMGKNAVFTGVEVLRDARPAAGDHPLVVLSHGSGGNAPHLAWIAAALAERGMVVAAPNHPGTTSRDSLPHETVKIWERPADLSAIIDHAVSGGLQDIQIDPAHVGAVGFSLGGYSVLGLGGAQVSKAGYIDYCDTHAGMMDCGWLSAGGVDLTQTDQARFEQSNLDARITAVVSVDPALSAAYVPASLRAMQMPVQLINLGVGPQVPAAVDAANLVDHFANAQLTQVAEATHFSFLAECTKIGEAIIADEGEEPICSETGTRARGDIHAELQQTIGDFLSTAFATGR